MNIFVSYTARDNEVTTDALTSFSKKISSMGRVFIDLLHNNSFDKQGRIIRELEMSDMLLLIKSQSTYNSNWVQFELDTASKKGIPIIEFHISEIDGLLKETIENRIFRHKY